jgi:hypothetical protein
MQMLNSQIDRVTLTTEIAAIAQLLDEHLGSPADPFGRPLCRPRNSAGRPASDPVLNRHLAFSHHR